MAGTINLANVALGFDASKITRGVDLTAGEMRKLNGIFQGSISNVDRYNAEMQILEKAHRAGALTADRLVQAEESLAKKYQMVNTELNTNIRLTQREIDLQDRLAMSTQKAAASQGGGVGMSLLGRGAAVGMAALGGGAVVKNAISSAADIQSTTLAFEVMTKSASKAAMIVAEMRKLDQQSPLGFAAIQQAGKGLIQYRIEAEKVVPLLRQLGDITMGDSEKFKLMAYALGQVKGAGRLMGQEARQMTDAGFNPLAQMADEMAQKFGGLADKYMPELKKKMEDGKISFAEVERAISAATSAGGTFAGMTERINKETTKGAITNMRSEWSKLSSAFGESLTPLTVMGSSIASFTASALAFPFNKWNEWARTFDEISRLNKEMSKEMEKQVEHKTQFVRLTQKQKDDEKRVAFKDERKDFESQINAIDEEYRKKIIGEEKFKEMQLLTALTGNEMIAGDREKREEALWQLSAIKQMEANEKAKKERDKQIEDEQKAKEQFGEKRNKIVGDLQEKQKKIGENTDPLKISQTIAPALKEGSVEAYKFMQGQKDKLYEAAQEQQKVLNENLEVAKKQLAALEAQPLLNKKR